MRNEILSNLRRNQYNADTQSVTQLAKQMQQQLGLTWGEAIKAAEAVKAKEGLS